MSSNAIKNDDLPPPDDRAQAAGDPAQGIGARLAAHRARRDMRVSALARAVGVSPSLISQIERGQSRPSVSTLFALAEALGVPVDAFFRDADAGAAQQPAETRPVGAAGGTGSPPAEGTTDGPSPRFDVIAGGRRERYVVRRDERAGIDIEGGVRWERLTPDPLDALEFLELVYAPGAESHASLYRHPGMEMVRVLSGTLVIYAGFERYELEAGDSMCFPSTLPHRYVNPTEQTTRAVTVILPDGGMHGPPHNQRRP